MVSELEVLRQRRESHYLVTLISSPLFVTFNRHTFPFLVGPVSANQHAIQPALLAMIEIESGFVQRLAVCHELS